MMLDLYVVQFSYFVIDYVIEEKVLNSFNIILVHFACEICNYWLSGLLLF